MALFDESRILGQLEAPVLSKLAAWLGAFVRDDTKLRLVASVNAPRSAYFEQTSITGATIFRVAPAQSSDQIFSTMVLFLDTASGAGRYKVNGDNPTATLGIPVPGGGAVIELDGQENIRAFRLIAEAAATLNITLQVFR